VKCAYFHHIKTYFTNRKIGVIILFVENKAINGGQKVEKDSHTSYSNSTRCHSIYTA
jgi:hypothetical protein